MTFDMAWMVTLAVLCLVATFWIGRRSASADASHPEPAGPRVGYALGSSASRGKAAKDVAFFKVN